MCSQHNTEQQMEPKDRGVHFGLQSEIDEVVQEQKMEFKTTKKRSTVKFSDTVEFVTAHLDIRPAKLKWYQVSVTF